MGSVAAHAREQGSDLHTFLLLQKDAQLLTAEPKEAHRPDIRHPSEK